MHTNNGTPNLKFFDPGHILSYQMLWNFVVGARSVGKTFNSLVMCVNRFIKHDEQFAYVRSIPDEIMVSRRRLFDKIKAVGYFPDYDLRVEGDVMLCDDRAMGPAIAVSEQHKYKGDSFPNLKWVVYDEFIPDKKTYVVPDMGHKVANLAVTLQRFNDVRWLFLANALTITNPMFSYLGIRPIRGREFTVFPEKEIAIQCYMNASIRDAQKNSRFGKVIAGTAEANFMFENDWLIDDYTFVEKMSGNSNYVFTMHYNGASYGVRAFVNKGIYYVSTSVDPNCMLEFAFTTDDHRPNLLLFDNAKNNPNIKRLKLLHDNGYVRFSSLAVKHAVYELLDYL